MTVKWTVPADNGGSPITAYRVVLSQRDKEIDEKNVTDPVTKTCVFAGLRKSSIYTLRVSARNFVFEGPFSQTTVQTKPEGKRVVNQIQPVNRSFSLTWPAAMQISWIKEFFNYKSLKSPQAFFSILLWALYIAVLYTIMVAVTSGENDLYMASFIKSYSKFKR